MSIIPVASSSGLQAGLTVINNVPSQKFPLVLSRVSQCIQERPEDLKPFSAEEEEKLSGSLGMSGTELRLMLDCCTWILKQAAFNITKPAVMQQQLSDIYKLNDDKVNAFVSTWTSQAKNIVGALKRKSVYPKQEVPPCTLRVPTPTLSATQPAASSSSIPPAYVSITVTEPKNIVLKRGQKFKMVEGVSWLLNAAVSSSEAGPIMEPRAVVELKLNSDDGSCGNLRLDLDSLQLQTLYETLETIQTRLDNLR